MISPLEVYLVTRLDSIVEMGLPLMLCGGMFGLFSLVAYNLFGFAAHTELSFLKSAYRVLFSLGLLGLLIKMFVPSSMEMAAIVVVPKVVNSEFVQETMPKEVEFIYGLAKKYVEKQVENSGPVKRATTKTP